MTAIEKETEKYISDVSSRLLCSKKKKKEIIEDIRGAVLDFTEANGTNDIKEVYEHFGTPEELAKAHLNELDPVKLKNKVNIRKVVIVALVVALMIFSITMILVIIDSNKENIDKIVVDQAQLLSVTNNIFLKVSCNKV